MVFISISETQKSGKVLGGWDCLIDPKSQHHEVYISISETQKPGTVLERWDWPKDPESHYHGCYFSISETQKHGIRPRTLGLSQKPGTVLGRWDCLKDPSPDTMENQKPGRVPEARDSTNIKVFDTCCRPLHNLATVYNFFNFFVILFSTKTIVISSQ